MVRKQKDVRIYLASDHAGYEIKEKLKDYFYKKKLDYTDVGPFSYREGDDYPDFAFKASKVIAKNHGSIGILICGSGAGMAIAANKVKGVRAVEGYDEHSAKMSREDNDANVLTLAARDLSFEKIKKIIDIWLKTPFSGEERHDRRIRKIIHFENEHLK